MTVQELAEELEKTVALKERRRIVGLILAEVGLKRLAGNHALAAALDAIATKIEQGAR